MEKAYFFVKEKNFSKSNSSSSSLLDHNISCIFFSYQILESFIKPYDLSENSLKLMYEFI